MTAIECSGVGKRYRRSWALRDCTLRVPEGHVVALVGPNGAGKTTLLHLAVGLVSPTVGSVSVLGRLPAGSPEALERVAFVAQDAPLYKNLSVLDMTSLAANLNRRFDQPGAERRLAGLDIPLKHKVGKLSGGQQAQLALTLALGRHPHLLVLDEPLARLDPLARHDFMSLLMTSVAEEGLSMVFSSHVVSELERVADYLILLSRGQLQLAGEIGDLLASHSVLMGPVAEADGLAGLLPVVQVQRAGRQAHLLVRSSADRDVVPQGWERSEVALEELVLAYLREPSASALPGPEAARVCEVSEVLA